MPSQPEEMATLRKELEEQTRVLCDLSGVENELWKILRIPIGPMEEGEGEEGSPSTLIEELTGVVTEHNAAIRHSARRLDRVLGELQKL